MTNYSIIQSIYYISDLGNGIRLTNLYNASTFIVLLDVDGRSLFSMFDSCAFKNILIFLLTLHKSDLRKWRNLPLVQLRCS